MEWAKALEKFSNYIHAHPDKKCLRCGLALRTHTPKSFIDCEVVLATAGHETLLVNRPKGQE